MLYSHFSLQQGGKAVEIVNVVVVMPVYFVGRNNVQMMIPEGTKVSLISEETNTVVLGGTERIVLKREDWTWLN